jgi:phytoene desaturase
MGPSWYWMPDVFEKYFQLFGKTVADYYELERLSPSYRIYFDKNDFLDIPAGVEPLCQLFESLEPGSSTHLLRFLEEGKFKYELGINNLVYKPGLALNEFADLKLLAGILKLHVFQSVFQLCAQIF